MIATTPGFLLFVLLCSTVGVSSLRQISRQNIPVTGVGSVRPLHSSSVVPSPSLARSTLGEINAEIRQEPSTNSSSSPSSEDPLASATNSSSSSAVGVGGAWTNSSSSSSSSPAVYAIETIFTNSSGDPSPANASFSANVSAVEEELIETIEVDQQVTVIGGIQLGELLCDSLVEAEDAPLLQFAISANETLIVNRTSYSVTSGESFTGGVPRRTWMGTVVEPEQAEDEANPRRVSMTWGEICDVETFTMEITRHHLNGDTTVVKSIPCGLSGLEICIVEVALEFLPDGTPLTVDFTGGRRLGGNRARRDGQASFERVSSGALDHPPRVGGRRNLQASIVEIQALVLYSDQALDLVGVSDVQMESMVSASFADANEGFTNSEIGIILTIVNQTRLPYEEGSSRSGDKLDFMRENEDVRALRNEYGADLVLLVGGLYDVCGIAFFLQDTLASYSDYSYALVNPNCFSNLVIAHEFGHILGCDHNRENTADNWEYAHGYRYCSGTDKYTTIMSYTSGCMATRANYFANPDVSYRDLPTGTATENCARAIEENKGVVANFRDQIYDGERNKNDENDDDRNSLDSGALATVPRTWSLLLVVGIALQTLACTPSNLP